MNDKLKKLLDRKDQILRNIALKTNDIENDFLTESFYNREDVSNVRKSSLLMVEKEIKDMTSELN